MTRLYQRRESSLITRRTGQPLTASSTSAAIRNSQASKSSVNEANSTTSTTTTPSVSTALMSSAFQQQFLNLNRIKLPRSSINQTQQSAAQSNSLTLAQSLGIEPKPAPKLTELEWQSIESLSLLRDIHSSGCPICCEPFQLIDQVLLSCCHSFHSQCLASFEKFSSHRLICPCCRKENYEKRKIYYGKQFWEIKSATLIQRIWRGYKARKLYKILNKKNHHSHNNNNLNNNNKKFASNKTRQNLIFARMNQTMENILNSELINDNEIDSLCDEFNLSITLARSALEAIDERNNYNNNDSNNNNNLLPDNKYWQLIYHQANNRGDDDCPICMISLTSRPCALLSCSHVIHDQCLTAFEKFHSLPGDAAPTSVENNKDAIINVSSQCCCPLCRAKYQKIFYKVEK